MECMITHNGEGSKIKGKFNLRDAFGAKMNDLLHSLSITQG